MKCIGFHEEAHLIEEHNNAVKPDSSIRELGFRKRVHKLREQFICLITYVIVLGSTAKVYF